MKDAPRTATWTYAHSLKYSRMSPRHETTHSITSRITQQKTLPSACCSILACRTTTSTARTKATRKEPKQMLPKDVVSDTHRLLDKGLLASTLKYQRPKTPQYVTWQTLEMTWDPQISTTAKTKKRRFRTALCASSSSFWNFRKAPAKATPQTSDHARPSTAPTRATSTIRGLALMTLATTSTSLIMKGIKGLQQTNTNMNSTAPKTTLRMPRTKEPKVTKATPPTRTAAGPKISEAQTTQPGSRRVSST
mmetsp:Transcript_5363/g.16736  ORF Transcript_5363/g.16736 Transcript_5363/m.16736 type:complete len:250 (-) Transcript_5363:49-798(-)